MAAPDRGPAPTTLQCFPRDRYTLLGVGGAGLGALRRLRDAGLPGFAFVAADSSAQALSTVDGATRILLDGGSRGLGCGGDASLGRAAGEAAADDLARACAGSDLVLLAAGLAGGTGGGAAPSLARRLRQEGAVVLGFGIMPFRFESRRRAAAADRALAELRAACDSTVTLDNDRLLSLTGQDQPLDLCLRIGDELVRQAAAGLSGMTRRQGWIHVDMPLVQSLLADAGDACLSLGIGRGPRPAQRAMRAALASPLSNMAALSHARAVLVQVSGDQSLELGDTADAIDLLRARLPEDCRLLVGAAPDPGLPEAAQVMLMGVGLAGPARMPRSWQQQRASLQSLPRRMHLDLERAAYVMDAPPLEQAI